VAYLAAYDVLRANVFGRCGDSTGIERFGRLVAQVMTQEPYASADRVYWIVDNGSSHRGRKAVDRLAKQFPNAIMVHTPVHASWLNQIEIYFSMIQRKALSANDFTDLDIVIDRLNAFRDPLQPDSAAVQMEIHHHRPGRTADQARQPPIRAQPDPAPSSLNVTPTSLRAGPLSVQAEQSPESHESRGTVSMVKGRVTTARRVMSTG
jgi:DDE superfamily endonuclease